MKKSLNKIINWINQYNFKIVFDKSSNQEIDFNMKIIKINKNTKLLSQIITLLHECGHLLIYNERQKYKNKIILNLNWKEWKQIFIKKIRRLKRIKIAILEEEIEAWNRGAKLAKKLCIKIPCKSWNYHKIRSLLTYTKYTNIT
jgi:hypothetical protein